MGLQKLVVNNFKSYAGLTEIPLDKTPFVSVVGPNGSGKSNLLDAICFVIGMSPSQLRCNDLNELSHQSSGNSGMYVAAFVTDKNDQMHVFKRTPSKFYVNNEDVSSDSYTSRWAEIKVAPNARNCVVLQGDIENLASAETDSLAYLIESLQTIAQEDIDSKRNAYAQLEKEISTLSHETRKNTTLRRTVQAEVDQAMELTNACEKLASLRSKLHSLERRRKHLVLAEKRATLDSMRRKVEEAHSRVETYQAETELVDADSRKLRTEYARKRRQLQNARNAEQEAQEALMASEAKLVPLQKKCEAIETEQRLLEPDLEFAENNVLTAQTEADSAEKALKLLERSHEREHAREMSEFSETNGEPINKAREAWMKLDTGFMTDTALEQDQLDELRRHASSSRQRYEASCRSVEDLTTELAVMETRVKQKELRAQQLRSLADERTVQQQTRREELAQVADELLSLRSEQRDLTKALKELSDKVRVADGNRRVLALRHKLLDAVERLRRSHKGTVYDLLGNLVHPTETKYAASVERSLGSNFDAIVVDTMDTAIECVSQARRERLGTLSFLPLTDLQNRELGSARAQISRQVAEGREARLLVDCVEFDRKFRPAVVYALGDSVFAPSFNEGLKLRRSGVKMRIIDINGSVISSNNIMSSSSGENSVTSASDRTLATMQRKAHTIAEKLKVNSSRETELRDDEIRLTAQIDRSIQTIEGAQADVSVALEQLRETQAATENLKHVLSDKKDVSMDLKLAANSSQESLDLLLNKLNEARVRKFEPFIKEFGKTIAEWDSRFSRGAQRIAEFSRQRQRLEDRLQLAIERRDAATSQLSRQKQRFKALKNALQQAKMQLSILESEATTTRQKLERAQSRLRSLRSDTESKSDEVGTAEAALEAARARLAEAERDEHLHSVALSAEVGAEDESSENEDSESNPSDADTSIKHSSKRKRTSRGNRKEQNVKERDALSIDRLDAKISELQAEIEPLVQISASLSARNQEEQTSQASQRYAQLEKAGEESRSHLHDLASRLSTLKEERALQFNEVLSKLQSFLSAIYLELVGGDAQAKLTPINSDEPFNGVEFTVMPPGKSFVPVSQLSGGERSMAALALLFSCQRLHPSPFVVLDEVDAALDFSNVASVSHYIRSHCSDTQFIVVSLKQRLFQSASHLVGVYKQKVESQLVTVAL